MHKLSWQSIPSTTLASILTESELDASKAVGTGTLYHIRHKGHEKIAISFSDGHAVIIELADLSRRRLFENEKN